MTLIHSRQPDALDGKHFRLLIIRVVRAARDSNPNRQIRRLVVSVHGVMPSAVGAAQVRRQIQPVIRRAVWYWLVD
jgi:hypothetical protein